MIHARDIKQFGLYFVHQTREWPKVPTLEFFSKQYPPLEYTGTRQSREMRAPFLPVLNAHSEIAGVVRAVAVYGPDVLSEFPYYEAIFQDGLGREISISADIGGWFDIEEVIS